MQTRHAVETVAPRVWRDLAALAAEAVAIGVLFSLPVRTASGIGVFAEVYFESTSQPAMQWPQ